MAENPFHAALVDKIQGTPTTYVEPEPVWEWDREKQRKVAEAQKIRGMTRQQMLEEGVIGVADLDDEELRVGRCRDKAGRIPRQTERTRLVPADLYDQMVAEHLRRSNEKLRSQMDVALGTMVDIMSDDTVEPRERLQAAQYLYERVAGKTPERVQVAVAKAPWEEVIDGIATISRAESRALRGNMIDAEVVDDVPAERPSPDSDGVAPTAGATGSDGRQPRDTRRDEAGLDGDARPTPAPPEPTPTEVLGINDVNLMGDLRIAPAIPVESHREPGNTSATAPVSNSERVRESIDAAKDLAERRKAAKKRIQDAKKRRAIARATGRDAVQGNNIRLTESDGRLRFQLDE